MSRFIYCMASASAEVAGRNRSTAAHTGVPAQINHAFLLSSKPIKRKAGDHPWSSLRKQTMSPVAYSPTSGAAFLNTARATRRPQSSRMNARRAEALSSARLANAVPGSSCPCNGPRSANSCSSNWIQVLVARFQTPIVRGEATIATEVVLGANCLGDRDFYVVKTTDNVFSDHSFQHRLEQSSVSLHSSNLFGALHSCLTDQDSMFGKCTCKHSTVVNATITTQGLWPTSPTDPQTTKLSKHSRLDGEPCPCRSNTTCWKVVPKSRMFKHR